MSCKFKDSMNRWVTVGLFEETAGENKEFILMTLDEARDAFISSEDVTGFVFATTHLGGWQHWKALLASPTLSRVIDEWVDELEAKKRAEALLRIEVTAREGHHQANRFLVDRGWDTRKAGRPSKEEIDKNINREKLLREKVQPFLVPVNR